LRFLITGGAGFLGSALANHLVREGHRVWVLDDLSAGDPASLYKDVSFTRGDVRDIPRLWTLLKGMDCVYHLAARVSVSESILYPVEYNDVNVGGTVSLMTAARDAAIKRVVFASSGTIYGEQKEQPIKETARPNPPNPYAVTKIAAEYYLSAMGALYGIETVILRIFNAYGPGQAAPPSHAPVIPQFVRQALSGGSVVIFGKGEQTRDFVYVDDVVQALVAAATAQAQGLIINIGAGREVSVKGLVRGLEEILGRRMPSLFSTAQDGGVSRMRADISLAQRVLGFTPQVTIEEGLKMMVAHYQRFLKEETARRAK
jgi:UDP-glucose 4-epimerase